MSTRGALAVIAGIVLALGVALAFLPTSIDDGIHCGSALAGADTGVGSDAFTAQLHDDIGVSDGSGDYVSRCADRIVTQRFVAFSVVAVGVLALLFIALTSQGSSVTEPGPRSDP